MITNNCFTVCLLIATTLLAIPKPTNAESDRPNIILCMADDMGWGDTGFNGHEFLKTPNLDRLAQQGLQFNRFYAAAPVCSPTRGSCLTGRHPFRYGIFFANTGKLKSKEICLAELLKQQGYTTGHFGKWHLGTLTTKSIDANRGKPGNLKDYSPPWENGFDVCFSTESKVPTLDPMLNPKPVSKAFKKNVDPGGPYGTSYWTGPEQRVPDHELTGDDSNLIVRQANRFMENATRNKQPFFAVVWFHAPHLPVAASKKHRDLYPDHPQGLFGQHYSGCISAMDESIGLLTKKLENLGIRNNTMFWYCTDNGPEGNAKSPGSAGPFRGRKRSLYEGGIRVPGILVWPDQIRDGRKSQMPCVTSDYFPTIVDVLNLPKNLDRPMDGISLVPLIQGKQSARNQPIGFQSRNMAAWSGDRYKLVIQLNQKNGIAKQPELFDLVNDSAESTNIADTHPEIVAKMKSELSAWQESCKKSLAGYDYKTAK